MVIHLVWPIVSTNQAVDGRFPLIESIYSIYTQYSELARTISISPKLNFGYLPPGTTSLAEKVISPGSIWLPATRVKGDNTLTYLPPSSQ